MEMIVGLVIAITAAIAVWMVARYHQRIIDGRDAPRPDLKKDRPA